MPLVQVADRNERVHAFAGRLTDADEQARGERDAELAGERDRPEPARGQLVGRPIVSHAALEETLRERLEHQPHAHVDFAQRGQIALAHDTGVGVGQEGRLLQNRLAHGAEIRQRRAVAVPSEELAVRGKHRLRLVAQREQGFLRTQSSPRLCERHDLPRLHRVGSGLARIAAERAVAAVVAAEGRQRHEDLGGKGDRAAPTTVTKLARAGEQVAEPRGGRLDERARVLVRNHECVPAPRRPAARRGFAARRTFGRTSWAKRSMFARTARSSCTV